MLDISVKVYAINTKLHMLGRHESLSVCTKFCEFWPLGGATIIENVYLLSG